MGHTPRAWSDLYRTLKQLTVKTSYYLYYKFDKINTKIKKKNQQNKNIRKYTTTTTRKTQKDLGVAHLYLGFAPLFHSSTCSDIYFEIIYISSVLKMVWDKCVSES